MRVLLRVAAALLLATPVFVALVIFFALTARRSSLSGESRDSRPLEREASVGDYHRTSQLMAEYPVRLAEPISTGHCPPCPASSMFH